MWGSFKFKLLQRFLKVDLEDSEALTVSTYKKGPPLFFRSHRLKEHLPPWGLCRAMSSGTAASSMVVRGFGGELADAEGLDEGCTKVAVERASGSGSRTALAALRWNHKLQRSIMGRRFRLRSLRRLRAQGHRVCCGKHEQSRCQSVGLIPDPGLLLALQ